MKTISQYLKKSILAIVVSSVMLMPSAGYATAYGYEYWGASQWFDIWIPKGQLFHAIEGAGLHIDRQGGDYLAVGNLCDTSVRFTYGGKNGKWTHYYDSEVRRGCSPAQVWKYNMNYNAPPGDSCMELWVKNWAKMVVRQCHYVH